MTPVKVYRSAYQGKIVALLYVNTGAGEVLAECAISAKKGTKVAGAAWSSNPKKDNEESLFNDDARPLIVLFKHNDRTYRLSAIAQHVVLCSVCGGVHDYSSGGSMRSLRQPGVARISR